MQAKHVNPFITAVQLVFETMLEAPVSVAKPRLKDNNRPTYDVTGIISLSGEIVGSAALSFPMQTALKCIEGFTGMAIEADDDMFTDAVGELANMVTGNAKKDLNDSQITISVPTVIVGSGHHLASHQLGPWVVLECECKFGQFNIEVCVAEVSALAGTGVSK